MTARANKTAWRAPSRPSLGRVAICWKAVTQLQQITKNIKFHNTLDGVKIRQRAVSATRCRCTALDKGPPQSRPSHQRIDQVDGGYGQQRRTRKWAAFAFANKPSEQTLQDEF
jgi:hypothetical protein